MDARLAEVDAVLTALGTDIADEGKLRRELGYAILATDGNDPTALNWLAAIAVARAAEIESD